MKFQRNDAPVSNFIYSVLLRTRCLLEFRDLLFVPVKYISWFLTWKNIESELEDLFQMFKWIIQKLIFEIKIGNFRPRLKIDDRGLFTITNCFVSSNSSISSSHYTSHCWARVSKLAKCGLRTSSVFQDFWTFFDVQGSSLCFPSPLARGITNVHNLEIKVHRYMPSYDFEQSTSQLKCTRLLITLPPLF